MKYEVDNFTVKQAKKLLIELTINEGVSFNEIILTLNDLINDNIKDKHTIIELHAKLGIKQRKEK